jgi:CreA protein
MKKAMQVKLMTVKIMAAAFLLALTAAAAAETVGEVSTAFKLIGPNHKVVVEVFDDPKVGGVSCYLSRSKTGGVSGALGLAEDKAESSVACRQVGLISFNGTLPRQEEVFSERASILFKHVRVVRMVDSKRNALVYLVYSDRLIDGSPKNSVTAVPVPLNQAIPVK